MRFWIAAFAFLTLPAFADREAARKATLEGNEAFGRGDYDGALKAYTRSIEADPTYPDAWVNRGTTKRELERWVDALEDYTSILTQKPGHPAILVERAMTYALLERWREALDDFEGILAKTPDDPTTLSLRGLAKVRLGMLDEGNADMRRALELGCPAIQSSIYEASAMKGDWKALLEDIETLEKKGSREIVLHYWKAIALTELGRHREAYNLAENYKPAENAILVDGCAYGYIVGTPESGAIYHPDDAIEGLDLMCRQSNKTFAWTTRARVLFLAGRPRSCLDTLLTRGVRTDFLTLLWIGAAQWKLEMFAEARATLSDARRLNPYIAAHAARIPEFGEFVASIDRAIAAEAKADPKRLSAETATYLLTTAEIETLVRRYEFLRAQKEYEKLFPTILSPVRRQEIEVRVGEIKGMASTHAKLVAAVNKGAGFKTTVAKLELSLKKADDRVFDFTITKGSGKFPWAYLDPLEYFKFAGKQTLTPEECLALGVLLWDVGEAAAGQKAMEGPAGTTPALKAAVDAVVARKRGIQAPAGGFVAWKGKWVTQEEKENLEKGLVRFQGNWVTPEDREKLARGLILVSGKWLPNDEKKLTDAGYRKYKDQWMSPEDYMAVRGHWAEAWTEETTHYRIRTNEGETFAQELASLVEKAWSEYRDFWFMKEPKLPAGTKMELWAFRSFEDYRRHCVDTKAEAHLNAAGFATSESNVVVGWNKTGNQQLFLQTMVHEAAHLYYFRVAAPTQLPSWHSEGMATYFEGFEPHPDGWKFGRLSIGRLDMAREAMKAGTHLPLAELLSGDALALINSDTRKALLFYAEAWALNFYLVRTDNPKYKAAYEDFRKAVMAGKKASLGDFFSDTKQLEKDWIAFVTGL